jgi:hypothetical protein
MLFGDDTCNEEQEKEESDGGLGKVGSLAASFDGKE